MNGYHGLLPPAALFTTVAVAVAVSLRLARGNRRPEAQDNSELYGWEDECGRPASRDKSYIPSIPVHREADCRSVRLSSPVVAEVLSPLK
ncbi:MAG: hypothetical protein CAPSK01_003338 [Candidatus Accumulibacter vicinus]|uniref:Uncharacterized protein n=1 Tax=Candidatus Accumulibacter vicinus TaxID=2954382 RepID=A0A084XXM7_9PROT|nr:MAG: hypothetical protein CAPSK01_003338 [Candidatus Accumulibacter vicinus]